MTTMIGLFKNLSIRHKLLFTFFLTFLLLITVVTIFSYSKQKKLIRANLENEWQAVSTLLAFNISPALVFEKADAVDEAFEAVKSNELLLFLEVIRPDGDIFHSYNPGNHSILTKAELDAEESRVLYRDDILLVKTPILSDTETIGLLVCGLTLSSLEEALWQTIIELGSISLLVLLIGVLFSFWLSKMITVPLSELVSITKSVAEGDYNVSFEYDSSDEIGTLAGSYANMLDNLKEVIANAQRVTEGDLSGKLQLKGQLADSFNAMLESLKKIAEQAKKISRGDLSQEIDGRGDLGSAFKFMLKGLRDITINVKESASNLASSSSEILAATSELTENASNQAAAISETTATVTELKQTAEQAAERANHVIELAKEAVNVSQAGLKSVESSVEGMELVQQEVTRIAEKISSLNSQTKKIGEIIATVNDIAEQSNLLALNASIEAARAGEQGRGFAVVADEVKNLANQSKQATAEVRLILNNIQKATHSAVMAASELNTKAEDGYQRTRDAGESIQTISRTIKESSNAAMQIAVSAREQTVGIDQIAEAMGSINQSVQQVLSAIEQTQLSAQNLSELSMHMKAMIDQYVLE